MSDFFFFFLSGCAERTDQVKDEEIMLKLQNKKQCSDWTPNVIRYRRMGLWIYILKTMCACVGASACLYI